MKEIFDDGVISKTVASDLIASLSKEKQEELISSMENVLKNWKDCMEYRMVLLHFKAINMRWLRINRKHQKRHKNN